jgi:hypothetical protein
VAKDYILVCQPVSPAFKLKVQMRSGLGNISIRALFLAFLKLGFLKFLSEFFALRRFLLLFLP